MMEGVFFDEIWPFCKQWGNGQLPFEDADSGGV
jgi:hypothetical protein